MIHFVGNRMEKKTLPLPLPFFATAAATASFSATAAATFSFAAITAEKSHKITSRVMKGKELFFGGRGDNGVNKNGVNLEAA